MMLQLTNNTPYSVKKMKAKKGPAYSVLNPETNSDSDSEKSNGARCVSAKLQKTHKGKIIHLKTPKENPTEKTW